ncbi:Hypothetical predicted protein [Olea europaea subsp. europaea]|uniref:Uncharacterized protein n=1 Tax=Olea europaea subsp. europaea TaxID=158383 RepID=A0A8S0QEK4_OLEEU|nr:Hypothetical predicted protein [Olea europaea subsp. europaea]
MARFKVYDTTLDFAKMHMHQCDVICIVDKVKVEEQSSSKPSTIDVQKLVDFLYEDLPHLFDDQGIDRTAYYELIKKLFSPDFQLHWAKQTGPYEITTRCTMVVKSILLPWKPELVFTGTSVMGINPETKKFCSHSTPLSPQMDYWDSKENSEYFSVEGLLDVVKQLWIYKTPEMETPKYQILKRTANHEVRKYEPSIGTSFLVLAVSIQLLGENFNLVQLCASLREKIPMTTPVFTQAFDPDISEVSVQIVLPSEKDLNR